MDLPTETSRAKAWKCSMPLSTFSMDMRNGGSSITHKMKMLFRNLAGGLQGVSPPKLWATNGVFLSKRFVSRIRENKLVARSSKDVAGPRHELSRLHSDATATLGKEAASQRGQQPPELFSHVVRS